MPAVEAAVVAGWVVSPVIKEVVALVKSTAVSEYRNFKDFRKRKANLEAHLEQLQGTVDSVHATNDNEYKRIIQLMDAIHGVQNIFDEFNYRETVFARMDKGGQIAHSTISGFKKLIGRDKAFNRFKKLEKELPTIQVPRAGNLVQLKQLTQSSSTEGTTTELGGLLPVPDKFFGYNKEYDQLVKALLNDSPASSSRGSPAHAAHVVAVIGASGTGKTAIAQRICSDDRVINRFGPPIWVSVSPKFSKDDLKDQIWKSIPVEIYRATIQSEPKCPAKEMTVGVFQQELVKIVASKTCLLVLDGLCPEIISIETWKDVVAPFKNAKQGSRILMTTRARICAQSLNAVNIPLHRISTDEMVLLLKEIAFKDGHKYDPDLEEILSCAAEKLHGLPSAAKDFVKWVGNKHNKRAWERALENYDFSVSLKPTEQSLQYCKAFCSIFPTNWKFEYKALVKMWISHGIISDVNGKLDWMLMQEVGWCCINALVSESFFRLIKNGRTTYLVIDEHLNSKVPRDYENNGFFRIDNDTKRIPQTARYLSVTTGSLVQLKNDPSVMKKLRTLLVFDGETSTMSTIDNDVLRQLRAVRMLDLAGTSITELPEAVGKLRHLRYLGLPRTVKRLPAAVTNLLHLQTLAAGECVFDEFPADSMNKLVNLQHLDVHVRYIAEVAGIGEMKNLQGPIEFSADKGQGHDMKELTGMTSLQGTLSIKGLQAVSGKEEAQKAQLDKKNYVDVLKLEWATTIEECSTSVHAQVLEGLKPCSTIRELHIMRYQGTSSPSWLANDYCNRLRYLYLKNCRHWEVLPKLGQLPYLKVVHLKEMESVDRIDNWFYGSGVFKSLEKLVLDDMPNLVEWTIESTDGMFPRLHTINILSCPKLEKLPQVPSTVKNMRIELNHTYLNLCCSSKSNSYSLEICGDAIRFLHEGFLHQNHVTAISAMNIMQYKGSSEPNFYYLTSVRSLSLSRCVLTDRQLSIYLQKLQSLEKLEIFDCSELQVFPHDAVLSSLKSFEVKGCGTLFMESLRDRPVWTRICSISKISTD